MASNGKQTRPWVYTLNRGLAQLVPLSFGYWLSVPISDILYLLWASKRETARRNHARILGRRPDDPIVERMAHRTFRQFGRYIVELLSVQGWSLEAMSDRIDIEGDEHFAEAAAHGKGGIFAAAPTGGAGAGWSPWWWTWASPAAVAWRWSSWATKRCSRLARHAWRGSAAPPSSSGGRPASPAAATSPTSARPSSPTAARARQRTPPRPPRASPP